MKTNSLKSTIPILTFGLLTLSIPAISQKLPNVQVNAIPVPKTIKIDGEPTEWSHGFEAYNRNIDAYYSVVNDSKNIYFIIQATDIDIVKKIVRGGITISINPTEKSVFSKCKSIIFPTVKMADDNTLLGLLAQGEDAKGNLNKTDSVTKLYNKVLNSVSTEIKLRDSETLRDSLISIYNEQGIAAAGALDHHLYLTYEFRIPFNAVKINYSKGIKLYYNIKFSGQANLPPRPSVGVHVVSATTVYNTSSNFLLLPTDFWGEYLLY